MDEWIEKMRTRYLSGHAEPWSREDLERLFPQANLHTNRGSREFGDTRHLHHHHHQPDTEDLFERFLSSSMLQDFVDGRRQVGDIWDAFRRGGGGGGRIGHRGGNDMFANIPDSDRQSHGRQPISGSDIFANILDSDRQFHGHQLTGGNDIRPDIDWELDVFEHQSARRNDTPPDLDWELDGSGRRETTFTGLTPSNRDSAVLIVGLNSMTVSHRALTISLVVISRGLLGYLKARSSATASLMIVSHDPIRCIVNIATTISLVILTWSVIGCSTTREP
jgi:hypothetical protein